MVQTSFTMRTRMRCASSVGASSSSLSVSRTTGASTPKNFEICRTTRSATASEW